MLYRVIISVLFLLYMGMVTPTETYAMAPVGGTSYSVLVTNLDSTVVDGASKLHRTVLHFRWDRTTYEESYLDNETAARMLADMLSGMDLKTVDSVSVMAYASPEGVYEHNMKLSRERASQFSRIFSTYFYNKEVKVNVRAGGEAWELLRERLERDDKLSETARRRIFSILNNPNISPDTKKWRFISGRLGDTPEEGDVYHYMLVNHYRYLRCMEVTIHYKEQTACDEPVSQEEKEPEIVAEPEQVAEPEPAQEAEPVAEPEPEPEPVAEPEPVEETKPYRPVIGLSTNIPYDITYVPRYGFTSVPSFSLEYYPAKGRYTFGADVEWPMWKHPQEHRYLQINNITLWARRYFKPSEPLYKGFYLLANVNAARYGIGFDANNGWEGEGIGASVGAGYKFYLGKRVYLEAGAALGLFYSWYDPYVWGNDATGRYYYDYSGNPSEFSPRRMRLVWFGPTRVFFSVGIDLFNRGRK